MTDGASPNERLLYAAREDNEDLLLEVFGSEEDFDINCTDPLGNTPLHLAVSHGSTIVLEHILAHEDCDVDPQNRLDRDTPLHLAIKYPHEDDEETETRQSLIDSLLEAGADTSIKNKANLTAIDLLSDSPQDREIRAAIRKAQAQNTISRADIPSDDEEEDGDGSGSESE